MEGTIDEYLNNGELEQEVDFIEGRRAWNYVRLIGVSI
jgi:antitoxin component YwqK of YwqJK toxin-antitoxin module